MLYSVCRSELDQILTDEEQRDEVRILTTETTLYNKMQQ